MILTPSLQNGFHGGKASRVGNDGPPFRFLVKSMAARIAAITRSTRERLNLVQLTRRNHGHSVSQDAGTERPGHGVACLTAV